MKIWLGFENCIKSFFSTKNYVTILRGSCQPQRPRFNTSTNQRMIWTGSLWLSLVWSWLSVSKAHREEIGNLGPIKSRSEPIMLHLFIITAAIIIAKDFRSSNKVCFRPILCCFTYKKKKKKIHCALLFFYWFVTSLIFCETSSLQLKSALFDPLTSNTKCSA